MTMKEKDYGTIKDIDAAVVDVFRWEGETYQINEVDVFDSGPSAYKVYRYARIDVDDTLDNTTTTTIKSDGGPSGYYDFKPEWVTLNDAMEHHASTRWGAYALHLKDAMKACWRFGGKDGTDHAYDARKLVYSGLRLLVMIGGVKAARDYLVTLLDDPQFRERS